MKQVFYTASFFILISLVGCQPQQARQGQIADEGEFLTVDFIPDVPLRYGFVADREIILNLDPGRQYSKGKGAAQKVAEKMVVEMTYKALEIDPYGYSIIQARCDSAKVTRTSPRGVAAAKDAVEYLAGRDFTLKISPTGKIVDYSSLNTLLAEIGEKAFSASARRRVKDPDMIMDFITTQWTLWDSVASIENPLEGVRKNQKWTSKLVAPVPFVKKVARNVTYELEDIEKIDGKSFAVIKGVYALADSPVQGLPLPYTGAFQMRGTFGFLRGYEILSIEGQGKQVFDIDRGLIKSDEQSYQIKVKASILGLGSEEIEPNIIINQKIKMTLTEPN